MTKPVAASLPASATHPLIALSGLLGFLGSLLALRLWHPQAAPAYGVIFVMGCTALAIFVPDLLWRRVHHNSLDMRRHNPSWARTQTKLAGLLFTLGLLATGYWLLPEYHGGFYGRYYLLVAIIIGPWLLLATPYIRWVDARMAEPEDGLWHLGRIATFNGQGADRARAGQYLLGWLVKGFFLPLMFGYACNDLGRFLNTDFSSIDNFARFYDFAYFFLFFIDVGLVSMGYLFSLRLMDNHIRSAEPTVAGWLVALVCYEPFWSLIGRQYLSYDTGRPWGAWFWQSPVLYVTWGSLILVLVTIYVWATVMFGARFSNLTHRGIITSGPYRWSKHPAYLAKNLSWWMISVPFLVATTPAASLRCCVLLLGLNAIYYARARTEERHLGRDPVYRQYADWVNRHGLLARLGLVRRTA